MKGFCPKVPTSGPHLNFYERNAITSAVFGSVPRPCPQIVGLFLVFTYVWQEDVAKNFLSARGPAQCKSGPGITCLVSVTIYWTIFR